MTQAREMMKHEHAINKNIFLCLYSIRCDAVVELESF